MDNNTVFDDIMQALNEVEEYQKGNIKLKSKIIQIPDDDINDMYNQLTENDKYFVRGMIKRLLISK